MNYYENELEYLLKTMKDIKIDIKFISGFNTIGAILTIDNGLNIEVKQINKEFADLSLHNLENARIGVIRDIIKQIRSFNNIYPPKYIEAKNLMLGYMSQLQAHYESQFIKGELVLLTNPDVNIYNKEDWDVERFVNQCFKICFNQTQHNNFSEIIGGSSISNIKNILKKECTEICEIRAVFLKDAHDMFEDYHNEDKEVSIETEWYSEKETPFTDKDLEELGFEHYMGADYEKIFADKKVRVRLLYKSHLNLDNFHELKVVGGLIFVHNFNENSYKMKLNYEGEIKNQKHLCELLNEYGK